MENHNFSIWNLIASKTEIECIKEGIGSEIFVHVYHTAYATTMQRKQAELILRNWSLFASGDWRARCCFEDMAKKENFI